MPVYQFWNGLSKDGHKGVGLTSREPDDKEFGGSGCWKRGVGRDCADAQMKQDRPRSWELVRQKAIAGWLEQVLQGCRCCERK